MTLLKCGHAAQATDQLGRAVCIICWPSPDAIEEADLPNLATRIAHCSYYQQCGSEKPSDTTLPFFEYRGPGSPWTNRPGSAWAQPDRRVLLWLQRLGLIYDVINRRKSEQNIE